MAPPGMVRRGLCQVRAARTKAGVALAPGGRSPRRASTRARSRAAHPASRSGLRTARRVPSSSRVPVSQGVRALADQARASGAQRWGRLSVSQPAAWEEGTQVAPSSSSPRSPAAAAISMMRAAASASRSRASAVRARARALTPPERRIVPPSRPHSSRRAATSRTVSSAWKEASEATTSAPTASRSPASGAVRGSRVRWPPRRARATWRGRMKRVRPWASLLRSSQPRSMSGAAPGAVPPARRVPAGGPQARACSISTEAAGMTGLPPAASSLSSSRVGGSCSALRGSAAQGPNPKGCGPEAASSAATGLPSMTSASRPRCSSASATCSAGSGRWAATSPARSVLSALSRLAGVAGLASWAAGSPRGSPSAGSPLASPAPPTRLFPTTSAASVSPAPPARPDSSGRLRATTASATASVGASSPARACSMLPGAPARVASARKEEDGGAARSGRATSRAATSRSGSAVRCTARSWVEAEGLIRTKIRPRPSHGQSRAWLEGTGVQIGHKGTSPPLRPATRTAESCGFLSQAAARLAPLSPIWTQPRRCPSSWPLVAPPEPPSGLGPAPHGSRATAAAQDPGHPARGDELNVGMTSLSAALSAALARA